MTGTNFPQSNTVYGPPEGVNDSQVGRIHAYKGEANTPFCDGMDFVIVAWQPSAEELAELNNGGKVFLLQLGGLAPHYVGTSFENVILATK